MQCRRTKIRTWDDVLVNLMDSDASYVFRKDTKISYFQIRDKQTSKQFLLKPLIHTRINDLFKAE